jgi:hypothetical protein
MPSVQLDHFSRGIGGLWGAVLQVRLAWAWWWPRLQITSSPNAAESRALRDRINNEVNHVAPGKNASANRISGPNAGCGL